MTLFLIGIHGLGFFHVCGYLQANDSSQDLAEHLTIEIVPEHRERAHTGGVGQSVHVLIFRVSAIDVKDASVGRGATEHSGGLAWQLWTAGSCLFTCMAYLCESWPILSDGAFIRNE